MRVRLSELEKEPANIYLEAFGIQTGQEACGQPVYRLAGRNGVTWRIPALVLLRAIFWPTRFLLEGNFKELAEYPDIAPTGLGSLVDSLASRRRAATSPAYTTTPADEDFGQKVVAAVVTSGFSEELAWSTYKEVASQGRGKNLSEAVHLCLEKLSTVTRSRRKQKASKADGASTGPARPPAQSMQPGDIRTYIAEAKATGRVLLDVMTDAGALKPVHEILHLPGF